MNIFTMNIIEFLAIFRVFIFWFAKCFAQLCRIDLVDFLHPETLIFSMLYNMSLCTFFPGGLKILQTIVDNIHYFQEK